MCVFVHCASYVGIEHASVQERVPKSDHVEDAAEVNMWKLQQGFRMCSSAPCLSALR